MATLDDDIKTQFSGRTLQVVSFALGSEEYGVDIAQVQEINRMVTITRVPRAPQFMEGVINLRGKRSPILPTPRIYSVSTPAMRSGASSICSTGIRKTSKTESTTIPTLLLPISVTTMRVFFVCSERSMPNRARRSTIGMRLIIMLDLARVISGSERTDLEKLNAA
jgi:purine-binding chemotaxis protein CheW